MTKTTHGTDFTKLPGLEGVAGPHGSNAAGIGIDDAGPATSFSFAASSATFTRGGATSGEGAAATTAMPLIVAFPAGGDTFAPDTSARSPGFGGIGWALLPAGFDLPLAGRPDAGVDPLGAGPLRPPGMGDALRVADALFAAPVSNPFGLTGVGNGANPTFADIDDDGDLDAFVGNGYGNTSFFRNTGSASAPAFTAEGSNFGLTNVGYAANPTFADIDRDGDLDAFVGANDGKTLFFRNTGSANAPAFSADGNNLGLMNVGTGAGPALADVDGDGDLDAFIGRNSGDTRFFRNTGSASAPAFNLEGSNFGLTYAGPTANPALADIDGDGDLDAFIGKNDGNTLFFRNTGNPQAPAFTEEGGNFGLTNVGNSASPTFADIDGDDDVDAFVGGFDGVVRFFLNTGAGVTITQSGGGTAVSEGGATDSYTVVLRSAPTADVTITLDPTNGQVSASAATLVFTGANWNVAQTVTVTAVNDAVSEGAHSGAIGHTVSSTDASYDGLVTGSVPVAITDNERPADPIFSAAVSEPFGLTNVSYLATPTFADIDRDGDLDAFVGNSPGLTQFFRNTGSASAPAFTVQGDNFGLTVVNLSAKPTLADIDGDGDLDAFVGDRYGNTQFFRNTGSASAPAFTAAVDNFGLTNVARAASPAFADIDADGDLDAFVGNSPGLTQFFRNTGSAGAPAFVAEGNNFGLTVVGIYATPTFADIDGDGDLDAFVGERYGSTLFFRNTGSASAPAFTAESGNFGLTNVGLQASPTFADIDGDGDLDSFVGNFDGSTLFFRNTAPGVTITQSAGRTAVTEGGATDSYAVVLRSAPTAEVTVTLDTTNGQVSASVAALVFTPANWNVAQTVVVTAAGDTVGEGKHTGVISHTVSSMDAGYEGLAAGQVRAAITDNDLQPGDPSFGAGASNPFGLTAVGGLAKPAFTDIDGDGDLDAFVGDDSGITQFSRNTGSASAPAFTAEGGNFGLTNVGGCAAPTFADIDGDGDLDAFVGVQDGNTLFFRNTGSASAPVFMAEAGNFGLTDENARASPTFADIDGDGDLDAFVGNFDGNTLFFRNTGSASAPAFTEQGSNFGLTDVGNLEDPAFADVDGDGDLDAFVGNIDGNTLFFRNTGSGSAPVFTAEGGNFGLTNLGQYASPAFADIDGDGDLDAFVGEGAGNVRFFVNNADFVVLAPAAINVTDTAFNDSFATVARSLLTRGAEAAALSYGITGGTDNGATVSKTSTYGVLTVTKATGAFSFVPNDAAIEALAATTHVDFIVTVGNGTRTESQTLTVNLTQAGVTETTGNDSLTGTTGPDRFDGLAGNDTLLGGNGNDTIAGGAGNDSLDGGAGNDSLVGGTGNDRYTVGKGTDVISETTTLVTEIDSVSSSASWTLGNHLETLTLAGSTAINGSGNGLANAITGNTGNNLLNGGSGNDTLVGGGGNDTLVGGTGNDSYTVDNGTDVISETTTVATEIDSVSSSVTWTLGNYLERLTLTGSTAINGTGNGLANTITGNTGNNLLAGGGGNDTLSGGSGNDSLDGGIGTDSLVGGTGNDSYTVDSSTDRISETTTVVTEIDSVTSSVAWTLGSALEKLTLTGSTAINGTGNALANTITGNTGNNLLNGSSGIDTLSGGSGNDSLDGGTGTDSLVGGAGNDSYTVDGSTDRISETTTVVTEIDSVMSSVAWTLGSYLEKLTLTGSTAINGTGNTLANAITGNTGNNLLSGSSGNDTLVGGGGNDTLVGGTGNDSYTVDSSTDRISETTPVATEIDSVSSNVTWTLGPYLEKLTLTGSTAINGTGNTLANTLTGNIGNNLLNGLGGNDTLNGASGNDVLTGSTGLDTFRFSSALSSSNLDTIKDFVAVDDAIQLENSVFLKLTTPGVLNPSFFRANSTGLAADSNDYIVYETDTGKLFYDADGIGAGAAVLFATLTGAPVISSVDFFVT